MCNTAPSPFSLCFSEIIPLSSNLRGLHLEVGSSLKLKDVGIDGGGKSDKSIECLSIYVVSKVSSPTSFLVR